MPISVHAITVICVLHPGIFDASLNVFVNKYLTVRLNAINLTNRVYLTSRHPAGLRAGHPFGIYAGANVQF